MNASSLILSNEPAEEPVLSAEQIAAQEERAATNLLILVNQLHSVFATQVVSIQEFLDRHPQGLTREGILAKLSAEQQQALSDLNAWAAQGLASFQPNPQA